VVEFFANLDPSELRLVRFMESRLGCGLMQRRAGADEMAWSRGVFTLLDLDPEIDRPSFSLLQSMQHPEDRRTFAQANATIEAAKSMVRKFRVIRRDGTMRVLSHHIEILFDENGKPDGSLGLVCDVTDHEALLDQADTFERRIEAISRFPEIVLNAVRPDGFVTDILGDSSAQEAEFDRRQGFMWRELIHPDDRAETLAYVDDAIQRRAAGSREHRIRQPDGTYRWRRTSWIPVLDRRGKLQEFVSISQDIENEKTVPTCDLERCGITGAQIRAARALAHWSVQHLSEAAQVSPAVIRRIEEYDGKTEGVTENLKMICVALRNTGVEFIFPPTGKPGVRPI
jgi:PAS domain-containing protein